MPAQTTDRATELRNALRGKRDEIQRISDSFRDETGDGHFVVTDEQHRAYKKAVGEAEGIKELLHTEEQAKGIFDFLDQPADHPEAGDDAAHAARSAQGAKSLSQQFLDSDAYQEMKDSGFRRFGQIYSTDTGVPDLVKAAAGTKDVYSNMGGSISIPALGTSQDLGVAERALRPGRVRDLFPAERTSASLLYGVRETGYTNRAATVPERTASDGGPATGAATDVYGLKPRSELTITPVTYPVATIAHLMYAHRQTLDDEPRMRSIIDRDMIDGVKMAEDDQILYGDGVGENITGIFNTPGIQTYTGLAADKRSAQIRRGITRAILAYYQPTGVVLHPFDWEHIELEQDANGAYTVAVSVAVGGEKRVWRLDIVDTPAITEGQYLLGAFGQAARLYDREQVSIQVSTENRDMFERNVVTLRCEERIAVEVPRPEAMVVGSMVTPA